MNALVLLKRCLLQTVTMSFLSGPFWLDKLMSELRKKRPENIRPKMSRENRAKQFAPFASLGRMDAMLKMVEEQQPTGDPELEAAWKALTQEDLEMLSAETQEDMSQ